MSIAAGAASAPLLQALLPARSAACSSDSEVITPKVMDTPVSSPTRERSFETVPARYSKCGV